MVRTWNIDFSCIRLTPTEIRKSKVSYNKMSVFSVGPPLRKISGSAHDKYSVYFMLVTLSGRSFIKIQYSSFPLFPVAYPFRIATQLQYYVKREKCKVNDVIFPSGCEAHTINLSNKNVKIGIFTGGASVRSKNIFTIFLNILLESMK